MRNDGNLFTWLIFFIVIGVPVCFAQPADKFSSVSSARPVPVLIYHHVEDLPPTAGHSQKRWTLSPKKFESHLAWLAKHGFQPVTMKELMDMEQGAMPLPEKPIVLTFDDGWKDHCHTVWPLLKKFGFKATFFVIPKSVGHSAYMDWPQIQELAASGMDIQSHSMTHPKLTTISKQAAWREISES